MYTIARITNITTVQKTKMEITIIAKIRKITNQRIDTGKYNKSLKDRRGRGLTNVTKIPKKTI